MKEELDKIIGPKNVLSDTVTLETYAGNGAANQLKPWFVAKPQDADQVQELVKWLARKGEEDSKN
ncbi:MAG: hypothetical protein WCP73_06085, partial [Eubacteriales bacterium]